MFRYGYNLKLQVTIKNKYAVQVNENISDNKYFVVFINNKIIVIVKLSVAFSMGTIRNLLNNIKNK